MTTEDRRKRDVQNAIRLYSLQKAEKNNLASYAFEHKAFDAPKLSEQAKKLLKVKGE